MYRAGTCTGELELVVYMYRGALETNLTGAPTNGAGVQRVRVRLQVLECSVFIGMAVGNNCPGKRLVGRHTECRRGLLGERTMVARSLRDCMFWATSGTESQWMTLHTQH